MQQVLLSSHSWIALFTRTLLRLRPELSGATAIHRGIAHCCMAQHLDPRAVALVTYREARRAHRSARQPRHQQASAAR